MLTFASKNFNITLHLLWQYFVLHFIYYIQNYAIYVYALGTHLSFTEKFSAKSRRFTSLCCKAAPKILQVAAEPSLCFQVMSIRYPFSKTSSFDSFTASSIRSVIPKRRPSLFQTSPSSKARRSSSQSLGVPSLATKTN